MTWPKNANCRRWAPPGAGRLDICPFQLISPLRQPATSAAERVVVQVAFTFFSVIAAATGAAVATDINIMRTVRRIARA
ncbi:hypothetical protein [Sphingomonas aquatilis]